MSVKGDTILWEACVSENITNWKIRVELYDDSGNSIKLATGNSGGSDDQIEKTDMTSGIFLIKVPSGQTTNMDDKINLEVEIDTGEVVGGQPEILTAYQSEINLKDEKITWTSSL